MSASPAKSPLAALRRLARPRHAEERCELCSISLPSEHTHLLEVKSRRILCTCAACALLFPEGQPGRFRRVLRRLEALDDFAMTDAQWESLQIPIHLAFFFRSSEAERMVALYPSPAGAIESLLSLDAWTELVVANPALSNMQPDVEALLVNRVRDRRDYYIAPIDVCYRLVGLIRMHWRGLSGGVEVWEEIDRFFTELGQRASREGRDA